MATSSITNPFGDINKGPISSLVNSVSSVIPNSQTAKNTTTPVNNTPGLGGTYLTPLPGIGGSGYVKPKVETPIVSSKTNPVSNGTVSNIIKTNDTQTGELTAAGKAAGATPMKGGVAIPKVTPVVQPEVQKTPEQVQLDSINHGDNILQYNDATGMQEWQLPNTPGYSETNPNSKINNYQDEADAGTGVTVRKLTDGTYARFNTATGTFAGGASQTEFNDAKFIQTMKTDRDNAIKGIYSPAQQAQINALVDQYEGIIDEQKIANANSTGANTIRQNMYGMGTNSIGQGIIEKSVSDGLKRITSLVTQKNSAVESMKQGFLDNDIKMIQDAYTMYSNSQKDIQNTIDKMKENATKANEEIQLAKKDNAISQIYDNGITDPIDIMTALRAQGIATTSKEVGETLAIIDKAQVDAEKKQTDVWNAAQAVGDYATASQVMSLDPRSPTFKTDLAKLQGGLRAKATQAEKDAYETNNTYNLFDSITGVNGKIDPYVYMEKRAKSSLSSSEFDSKFAHYLEPTPDTLALVGIKSEKENIPTAAEITQTIYKQMADPAWKTKPEGVSKKDFDEQKRTYIRSLGANPADYEL